jgi:hypothetical protein
MLAQYPACCYKLFRARYSLICALCTDYVQGLSMNSNTSKKNKHQKPSKEAVFAAALDLAQLIYDIYQEEKDNDTLGDI